MELETDGDLAKALEAIALDCKYPRAGWLGKAGLTLANLDQLCREGYVNSQGELTTKAGSYLGGLESSVPIEVNGHRWATVSAFEIDSSDDRLWELDVCHPIRLINTRR